MAAALREERDALRYVYERLYVEKVPVPTQYRLLYPFLSWFNRNAGSSYVALSQREPISLLFLLYHFSVVLALVAALPATDTPFFASFRVRAVMDLAQTLGQMQGAVCQGCKKIHEYARVTEFPFAAVELYQQLRRGRAKEID
jgi:hypothetical protein